MIKLIEFNLKYTINLDIDSFDFEIYIFIKIRALIKKNGTKKRNP